MAFGNYSPYYRNYYGQPAMNEGYQMTAPMQVSNDMLWVLNENEAMSYPVAPNNTVVLWDKNKPTIYVKSVDGQRIPSMRTLDFTERNAPTDNSAPNKEFVSTEQFNELQAKFEDLNAKVDSLAKPKTTKEAK